MDSVAAKDRGLVGVIQYRQGWRSLPKVFVVELWSVDNSITILDAGKDTCMKQDSAFRLKGKKRQGLEQKPTERKDRPYQHRLRALP
ncbi:hypothetical protein TNIN_347221 [Trichonephila inaurata madagascariensis]|uniref:Uncharacterized protein n=1 Tax=Trichonephila inaurata madagascariensis TaxID=2747483 RepID=A0A8X7C1C3_9ARAC|nr:hypothetical protein TNIN_347221 [Trichonephila inaurata madagascariensis]